MKKTVLCVLAGIGIVSAQSNMAIPSPAAAKPPLAQGFSPTVSAPALHLRADNLTDILGQLRVYQQTGQYEREIAQVVEPARLWIETRTARAARGEKLAAVFDIDETTLSNLPYMMECGFCSESTQAKLFPADRLPAIEQVRGLYHFAKSKGVAVIFVTGRHESARSVTVRNLQASGFSGWEDLEMRPDGNSDSAQVLKANIRQRLERTGFRIILNIGDQLSDLAGGYSERTYKLPDPFYFVK